MKGFLIIISVLFLSGCWVHRDLISFKSTNYNEFNFVDHQVHFEIVKDQKSQTFPFVFVEKSGKKDRWLVSASFITPEIELASITIDVTITNLQGEVLFEANDRKVELIEFDDYRAKAFDFGTFEKKEPTNLQDTLLAIYHVNTLKNSRTQSFAGTSYLVFTQEKKSGSFY